MNSNNKENLLFIHRSCGVITGQSTINSEAEQVLIKKFNVINIELGGFQIKGLKKIFFLINGFLKFLFFLFFLKDPYVYISHSRSTLGILADLPFIVISILIRAKLYLHWHGAEILHWEPKKLSLKKVLLILSRNKRIKHIVLSQTMKVHLNKLSIYNVKIVNNFSNMTRRRSLTKDITRTAPTLLFCSNLLHEKGIFDAIEVYREVVSLMPSARLNIIGSGSITMENEVILSLQGYKNAKFFGAVYGEEKQYIFEKSDLLLFPSTYVTEAQPLVVIEAMSLGIPTIAYKNNLMSDIINDDVGILVAFGRKDEITHATLELLCDHKRFNKLSDNCMLRSNKYSRENFEYNLFQSLI